MSKTTQIIFVSFGLVLTIFMASTSAIFGYQQLTIFGDNEASRVLGALLALLISDIALWAWFLVRKQPELTTTQRAIAIILSTVGFILSVMFTVGQITLTTALGDFIDRSMVQFIVMILVVIVTSLNALGLWLFGAKSASDQIKNMMSESSSEVLDHALKEAKQLLKDDQDTMTRILAHELRGDLLGQVGFTGNLKRIGKDKAKKRTQPQNEPIEGQLVTASKDTRPATAVVTPTPQDDITTEDFHIDNDNQRYVIILANGKRPYMSQSDYRTAEALARSAVDMTSAAVTIHDRETGKDAVIDPKES